MHQHLLAEHACSFRAYNVPGERRVSCHAYPWPEMGRNPAAMLQVVLKAPKSDESTAVKNGTRLGFVHAMVRQGGEQASQ